MFSVSSRCRADNEERFALKHVTQRIEGFVGLWLIGCIVAFVLASSGWPLTGDASLIHYVVFLMHHGIQPYRDIVDMNLPGAYVLEAFAMSVFGAGSAGCRVYDLSLLALASVSFFIILRRRGRLAGLLASALFILIHGRDGPLMTSERDLAAAAFFLFAAAMLFTFFRGNPKVLLADVLCVVAGASAGMALCIKPTLLPLAGGLFLWMLWMLRRQGTAIERPCASVAVGTMLPLGASAVFLFRHHAIGAFWRDLHGLIPYHASIDNFSLGHLLWHSISPLLAMLLLWLAAAWLLRDEPPDPERIALMLCALGGLLSYLLQRKAFWYQRYPYLAFLIPIFVIDFTRLLRSRTWERCVGIAGMATGVVLATACLFHLKKFDRGEPPRQLLQDLSTYGTPQGLSGRIQCMDTIGGCIDALYHDRIVQSTGFLYDCYMLDGNNPVALDLRRRFWQQMERNPPRVIVVTDSDCYRPEHNFNRFAKWPEFQSYLATNFVLERESGPLPPVRYWSHPMEAYQYRVYVRR